MIYNRTHTHTLNTLRATIQTKSPEEKSPNAVVE